MQRSWLTINLTALQHNWQQVKAFAPASSVLAMVKSNAYGHGLVTIAQNLPANGFGVACLAEGLALRQAGIQQLIVIMSGVQCAAELRIAAEHRLALVIHHNEQVKLLEKTPVTHPLTVWLKLDSGMHRLGIPIQQAASTYERLQACPNVRNPLVTLTHLASADNLMQATTKEQIALFKTTTASWNCPKSIANSAGIIAWPDARMDWVRPGIMLYGVSPFKGRSAQKCKLQPVMSLYSRLIAINTHNTGDALGYAGQWICPETMPVGVVAIGYGDGYPRHVANGTPVLIRGIRCPIVGLISMDMLMVDLRGCPTAQLGDVVTLWGAGLPVEEIAEQAGTIGYELLCQVTSRVQTEIFPTKKSVN